MGGWGRRVGSTIVGAATALATGVLLAVPWLDQRLVWCEWLAVAAILLMAGRIRGWRGEAWTLAAAVTALALAFHWAPAVLAAAMNAEHSVGLMVAAPIVLWDAVRLALPFWLAARVARHPLEAWLPAGLAAAHAEAFIPAIFPWKLGYAQAAWPVVVQAVDLFGPEFATFVLFAHAGAVACLLHALAAAARPGPRSTDRLPRAALLAIGICAANVAYGIAAFAHWQARSTAAPRFTAALVQANPADEDGIEALRRLTHEACSRSPMPDLVCWPECSGGCYEAQLDSLADPELLGARSRPPHGGLRPLARPPCPLLFGGKVYEGHPERPRVLHQSAILLDTAEAVRGRYHKRHLMPFGEYVPGGDLIPEIRLHFPMAEDFTPGDEARVLDWGGGPRLGVMLCYEDMVPGAARSLATASANVLVSLINGSAFTERLSLVQHRLLAQLRAVENRRCLLRCAATGETCVILPTGVVAAAVPLHARDALVFDVPLLDATTLSQRLGPAFPLACGAAVAVMVLRRRRSGRPVSPPRSGSPRPSASRSTSRPR